MSYNLIIVESPSKCKKIEQYLNKHQTASNKPYKCLASYGHIRELSCLEGVDIHNNFAPTFVECVSKKEQISKLKKAIKDAAEVILASDDDREGEAIAWHICQVFNLPIQSTKRIIFHEITETALHKAIESPTTININRVNAQMARQVLDLLVGYKLSPLLWKHVKDGLSAGRCQTPALRLVYENEIDFLSAPGKQSYTITGYFTNSNIPFILNHEEEDATTLQTFLEATLTYAHKYNIPKLQTKTRAAPEPFTTSSLQQYCSNELHLSPKETMSACQVLYEDGYITYHRTDSKTYSDEFKETVTNYITATYGAEYIPQVKVISPITKKLPRKMSLPSIQEQEQEGAHEAIRVTHVDCKSILEVENKRENRVYQLIRKRTLESCMTEATVSVLTASITAPQDCEYHYTTEQVIFPGWKIVDNEGNNIDAKNYAYLQTLKHNSQISYKKIKANLHLKELKTHYTEARLVQLLEEKGIGRPSTFSTIIDKIQERKYVKKENIKGKLVKCIDYEVTDDKQLIKIISEKEFGNEKNKLVIQPVGTMTIEFLLNHFDNLFQYAYTKQMEDDLDLVSNGEKIWYEVCRACYTELENQSSNILEKGKETIRIDAKHTYMISKYGPVIKCSSDETIVETKKRVSKVTFKNVRKDIDLNKLRRGEYTIEDIQEQPNTEPLPVGLYMDKPVYIKTGKFGKYLEWNNMTKSLKHLKQPVEEITLEDVSEILFDINNETSATLRVINEDASICKGKYGNYIFYKNNKMKKPRFLKLDKFTGDYLNCELSLLQEWLKTTYMLNIF